jgi:hypothetical protein
MVDVHSLFRGASFIAFTGITSRRRSWLEIRSIPPLGTEFALKN